MLQLGRGAKVFLRILSASLFVLCSAVSNVGQAKELHLPSSSKWLMDYADDSCRLSRAFGSGDNQTIVQFTHFKPEAHFDLVVSGKPIGARALHPSVRLRFGTEGEFVRTNAMLGTSGKNPALFLSGRLDNLDLRDVVSDAIATMTPVELARLETVPPATEARVNSMTLIAGSRTIVFELGSMGPPMAAMRKCISSLITQWGLNPDEQAALVSLPSPKSSPARWLTGSDYPASSLARGEQAIIRFRLMVDPTGATTACNVQSAIAEGDFASVTCDLLKRRARFEPARNAKGEAVASYYVGKVRWMMP